MCSFCKNTKNIIKVYADGYTFSVCLNCNIKLGLKINLICDICKQNKTKYFLHLSICNKCSKELLTE